MPPLPGEGQVDGRSRNSGRARLGAHMSVAGGLPRAIERAVELDATALQIFVKSARQWKAAALDAELCAEFRRALSQSGLAPFTMAHASYLINLASADPALRERSIEALADELDRCCALGVPYLVLHPGSHLGAGEEEGVRRVSLAVDSAMRGHGRGVRLLLETTAGQGTNLGHRFEQIGAMIRGARSKRRLGVCFDTCHAYAAGYGLTSRADYDATFADFERHIGLARLHAFHLNDSKHDRGTRRDRHEDIGQGTLGHGPFRRLLNDPRFFEVPMVLETPKGDADEGDRKNLACLRAMLPRERR